MEFLSDKHKERFKELILKDKTNRSDVERLSLFYILSGNEDLYCKSSLLYDFKNNMINIDNDVDLTSGTSRLVDLAFNLYNDYSSERSILDTFSYLDFNDFELAIYAIRIRFNKI